MNGTARSISDGIARIAAAQDASGGFPSLSSPDAAHFTGAEAQRTVFATAQVLICLNGIADLVPESARTSFRRIRREAARFLVQQRSEQGSWNYWAREEILRRTRPYPDDCDDTFASLAALAGFDSASIDGAVLAQVARFLTAVETRPGGPYRTWLVDENAPEGFLDVDPVVNAAIATFLAGQEVELPNLEVLLTDAIRNDAFCSRYYPGPVHAAYLTARGYRGPARAELATRVLARQGADGLWGDALETALAVSCLIRLGAGPDARTRAACRAFLEKAAAKPHPFCIDIVTGGVPRYMGAAALTDAFRLEALALLSQSAEAPAASAFPHARRASLHEATLTDAARHCVRLGSELREIAVGIIAKNEDREITLLPYRFAEALGSRGQGLDDGLLGTLARANLWGWLAYTVYDGFLDGEGDPRALSAANVFLRTLTEEYAALGARLPGLDGEFARALDAIDHANAWEQERCRPRVEGSLLRIPERLPFATYDMLANRSIGHALPAIALLHAVGTSPEEVRAVKGFFKHYLIARQLHDDAHDWAEDLSRGQLNSVGARVLAAWQRERPGAGTVDLVADLPALRELFWRSVAGVSVRAIQRHAAQARKALRLARLPGGAAFGDDILGPLERSAARTLRERAQAVAFLEAY